MSDISAISADRVAALRNEARFQRNQQEQTRIRQDEERRVAAQRQARVQDISQRVSLERADTRIAQTTQSDPNLPRGSIVDITG